MGYLKLKSVLQRYFPTPNKNYSNLNYFMRNAAGALRAPMSAISCEALKGDLWTHTVDVGKNIGPVKLP